MNVDDIKQAWLEVFPNGAATERSIMGSTCVGLYVQNAGEWYNGIPNNDPLVYKIWIESSADGAGENLRESDLHILTKPPEGANLVYRSAKMRKQTIKNADYDKIVKRFQKVRAWIESQDLAHTVNL